MNNFLRLIETYASLQGEGRHSGMPCWFIRTAGCDLKCRWCDTPQALSASAGAWSSLEEILQQVPEHIELIQITGGEPLLQKERIITLAKILTGAPYKKKVLLETGGHQPLEGLPSNIHIVMDIKLPGSNEHLHDFQSNIQHLKNTDEIKFVIADRADFDAALDWINRQDLQNVCKILLSPVWGELSPKDLAEWTLESRIKARVQTQLHKIIWGAETTGV